MRRWSWLIVKSLLALVIAVILGVLLWELRSAYGDPSEPLMPDDFAEWKTTKILTSQPYVWIIAANPDVASTIRAVAMAVTPEDMRLMAYKYFVNGVPRSFSYNHEKEKFIETELTSEQKRQCFECHKHGQVAGEMPPGDAGRKAEPEGTAG